MSIKLQYGQIVRDNESNKEYRIAKYWESDTDPDNFKIKLERLDSDLVIPMYSWDLKIDIKFGYYSIL